jgi:hypothetical protein
MRARHYAERRPGVRPAGSERFSPALLLLDALEGRDHEASSAAARGLALICHLDPELPPDFTSRMLWYFEHLAKYSPYRPLREACIDAICICRDLGRLRSLDFQPGCFDTSLYRDRAASALSAELEMKC